jgi:hypothetical protein
MILGVNSKISLNLNKISKNHPEIQQKPTKNFKFIQKVFPNPSKKSPTPSKPHPSISSSLV